MKAEVNPYPTTKQQAASDFFNSITMNLAVNTMHCSSNGTTTGYDQCSPRESKQFPQSSNGKTGVKIHQNSRKQSVLNKHQRKLTLPCIDNDVLNMRGKMKYTKDLSNLELIHASISSSTDFPSIHPIVDNLNNSSIPTKQEMVIDFQEIVSLKMRLAELQSELLTQENCMKKTTLVSAKSDSLIYGVRARNDYLEKKNQRLESENRELVQKLKNVQDDNTRLMKEIEEAKLMKKLDSELVKYMGLQLEMLAVENSQLKKMVEGGENCLQPREVTAKVTEHSSIGATASHHGGYVVKASNEQKEENMVHHYSVPVAKITPSENSESLVGENSDKDSQQRFLKFANATSDPSVEFQYKPKKSKPKHNALDSAFPSGQPAETSKRDSFPFFTNDRQLHQISCPVRKSFIEGIKASLMQNSQHKQKQVSHSFLGTHDLSRDFISSDAHSENCLGTKSIVSRLCRNFSFTLHENSNPHSSNADTLDKSGTTRKATKGSFQQTVGSGWEKNAICNDKLASNNENSVHDPIHAHQPSKKFPRFEHRGRFRWSAPPGVQHFYEHSSTELFDKEVPETTKEAQLEADKGEPEDGASVTSNGPNTCSVGSYDSLEKNWLSR